MTDEEAYQLLGLMPGASDEAVLERFREVALEHHPDQGGDHSNMASILAARDQLLRRAPSTALVPASMAKELVTAAVMAALAPRRREEVAERQFERIIRLGTSRLRRLKRQSSCRGIDHHAVQPGCHGRLDVLAL